MEKRQTAETPVRAPLVYALVGLLINIVLTAWIRMNDYGQVSKMKHVYVAQRRERRDLPRMRHSANLQASIHHDERDPKWPELKKLQNREV